MTSNGTAVSEQEESYHCTDNGPTKLCSAHFTDGTCVQIPGMFGDLGAKRRRLSTNTSNTIAPHLFGAVADAATGDESKEGEEEDEE